jgi:hypothetical protein
MPNFLKGLVIRFSIVGAWLLIQLAISRAQS